ncbi:MAG TPA: response regulator [Sphingomonas sp.]|uniref:hybrid sensor histidine kinase/response regulator n=1 Tax=Sphingomonas sp. TaxID=28214 RepID=UPI002C848E19|nr:response regulator [Sphingomonas sp.]HMI20629.1 response regulator [Sphingomonas sp.]
MRATLPHSIRGRLIALTLALLLPALVVTSVLLWRAYAQEHVAAERQLSDTARALSLVVDREIGQSSTLLEALATSNRLKRGSFDAFALQAREANADPSRWVVVLDADGQQLVNSAAALGARLPRGQTSNKGVTYTQLGQGIRLWNLSRGSVTGQPVVVLAKTLRLNDGRMVELTIVTRASSFLRLFADQQLPERWTGVVLDGSHRIVARNRNNDLYVGHQASAETQKLMAIRPAFVRPSTTLDGIAVITAWNRSPVTGWVMAIAVPRSELAAGAWSSLVAGAALGLVLIGIGLLVSYRVGRSVALPIGRLAAGAAALGRGEDSDTGRSTLVEIQAVQDALRDAGAALHAREQELQALNNNLELRVMERTRELAEAAETLIQAQKMEAVGRLTGGIAHDFNNLLTAVIGNIDLLQRTAEDERAKRLLGSARQAAERGAKLTGQLLAFSRRQQLRAEVVDINRAVENTVELLKSTLGGATSIVRVPSADLWLAHADPTQLDLILLNLAINARDAMPAGGSILIETANITIGEAPRNTEEPPPGDFVAITLADRGTGMTPEILARAFDPFFTTKPVGQGTGLGLPQVLGVLKQLGGGIRIKSRVGEGTSVTVFLPRSLVERPPEAEIAAVEASDLRGLFILLVDDDPDVRGVAASILRETGCLVVEAESGRLGLKRLAETPKLDLVLIDFAMPGMNGAEVALAIREQRPELPILLMSGYADVEVLSAVWDGPFISKPFTANSLQARIAEAVRRHRVTRLRGSN